MFPQLKRCNNTRGSGVSFFVIGDTIYGVQKELKGNLPLLELILFKQYI